ncbi:PDZ domain-containing protein [Candidatus Dependentiae bacterium]|nr:MAG: PDZ domain-containing protein [Candidatus Dependentiae bacterium]
MKRFTYIIATSFIALLFLGVPFFLFLKERLNREVLQKSIDQIKIEQSELMKQVGLAPVERLVTKSEVWRPIQEQMKDTVVQVFAQISELDMCQPYKTPAQGSAYGSAFFINEQGDLITNAHVVNQAQAIWIQIPSLGKRIIDVDVLGIAPERDLALLKVQPADLEFIRKTIGHIPFLPLGDSDQIRRADEVLALGYPLGQQSLKSTSGVVSGRESHFIQTSAPINPGNSGGPLLNINGEVVGVNTIYVPGAQNVGYAVPINDLKIVLSDLYKVRILHLPFLGILYNNANDTLVEFLRNPKPGGCYITEVIKNSTLEKAGVRQGDMLYSMNGYDVDLYGEMKVPWSEDKISILDYRLRLSIGDEIRLIVYHNGERKEIVTQLDHVTLPAIRIVYPAYEDIDYEVFGGMVVMELTLNHLGLLANKAPGLARFTEMQNQVEPVLIVTHIFRTSQLYRVDALREGSTINELNGEPVRTLNDFRKALRKSLDSKFVTVRVSDNIARISDNILIALPFETVLAEESRLSREYHYQLSEMSKELITDAKISTAVTKVAQA